MLKVLQAGFYSSIQDMGRFDFQEFGVPISGVMDSYAAKLANTILGNQPNHAVLEITLSGPKLEFLNDTLICITGADLSPQINNRDIPHNIALGLQEGDILNFNSLEYGCRCYLAVLGGFQTEMVMNSRSMYKNITNSFKIQKEAILPFKLITDFSKKSTHASIKVKASHFQNNEIEVYTGPEFDLLTHDEQQLLLNSEFTVAPENSRMAYQLKETISNNLSPIITSLVLPGTVQLTPSGKLILLMRDCQTTGGYPRVFQLSEEGINTLAQKFTNDKIQFKLLS
ncbi:MAG: biotin-dependent carboxyltransferase family protein [Flavobacteriaceae bacterium]|nr:biotin-dependent carboxyltransferase family protein [Flavobacteriaceae bacterium]